MKKGGRGGSKETEIEATALNRLSGGGWLASDRKTQNKSQYFLLHT